MIASGLLTSLDVVGLVLFVEELRGEEIDPDAIEPEAFATIDSMVRAFLGSIARGAA